MKKRIVMIMLASLFLLVMLASCGDGGAATTKAPADTARATTAAPETKAEKPGDTEAPEVEKTTAAAEETEAPEKTEAPAADTPSDLEPVTLPWYLAGNHMPDTEMVIAAINEYLQEKLNTTVDMYYWPGTEWAANMPIKMNAQEDVGIISFGVQTKMDYVQMAQRGQTLPLDELFDEYGQGVKALFDDGLWDGMRVNGQIYGIPTLKDNCYIMSFIYNKELVEDLELDMGFDFTNWRDMEDWLMDAKAKRDAKYPGEYDDMPLVGSLGRAFPYNFAIENFISNSQLASCNIDPFMEIAGKGVDEVFCLYATPEYREYAKHRFRLVDAGVMAYDYTDKEEWKQSTGYLGMPGWGYTYMTENLVSDNWTSEFKVSTNIFTDTGNYHSAGTSISSNSANPERCMMVLNLVNTDTTLATMLRFGVEGEHYIRDENGKMTMEGSPRNSDVSNRGYFHWYFASVGNLMIVEAPPSLTGPNNEMLTNMDKYNKEAVRAAHLGFVFDQTSIQNEYAACASVVDQYEPNLNDGRFESEEEVDAQVDEFVSQLEANGYQAIIDECQRQLDEWLANRG